MTRDRLFCMLSQATTSVALGYVPQEQFYPVMRRVTFQSYLGSSKLLFSEPLSRKTLSLSARVFPARFSHLLVATMSLSNRTRCPPGVYECHAHLPTVLFISVVRCFWLSAVTSTWVMQSNTSPPVAFSTAI